MPPKGSKKKAARTRWTVVQHSGFGYGNKPGFEKALETRQLDTEADQQLVLKVGGKLFDSYTEATEYEENNVGEGMLPQAPGTFSEEKVDGLRIYIPPTEAKKG